MGVGSCVPAIILIIIGVLFQHLPALCNTVTFNPTNPPHTTTMPTDVTFKEGYATFPVPGIEDKPCQTYYQVIGDLHSGHAPIVALNGGPGANYQYLLILSDVTKAKGNALVVYDQIGIGKSTHYREKAGDTSFWVDQLFLDQLDNLLVHLRIQDRYIVIGHSWGGMLASRHAVQQPPGLTHLILMSAPADMHLWVTAQNGLRTELPQDVQDVLTKNEKAGTTDSEEYQAAVAVFNSKFLCRIDPMPDAIAAGFAAMLADPTVYMTM